jgi:RNA polymerase sigma-70 factor (ECF subfamily)
LPEPEAIGLLALMLLQESRREARSTPIGRSRAARRPGPQPLGQCADRRRKRARAARARDARFGPYCLQAAIAAVHAAAPSVAKTDWNEIVGLYEVSRASTLRP